MVKKLLWQPVVAVLEQRTKQMIAKHAISWYVAIFMLWDNHPWQAYVRKKTEYAKKLGRTTIIYSNLSTYKDDINQCNNDPKCLGIVIQLPLPKELESQKQDILNLVHPAKDPDCLWEKLLHQTTMYWWHITIAPATPSAVMHVLNHYHFQHAINGQQIAVLWESDLIWKPLAKILAHLWWYVHTFNEHSNQRRMRQICKESDIIIAATWKMHLVDDEFIRPDQSQVVIDVGRWYIDWNPAGDVYAEKVEPLVSAITPVPGGIWPVTVASLFWNIVQLYAQRNLISS
jgi:methylenetetrahydrofolate dehydrogenase (NADP+) / methenyltetrahydrofolate cyclohydrolase